MSTREAAPPASPHRGLPGSWPIPPSRPGQSCGTPHSIFSPDHSTRAIRITTGQRCRATAPSLRRNVGLRTPIYDVENRAGRRRDPSGQTADSGLRDSHSAGFLRSVDALDGKRLPGQPAARPGRQSSSAHDHSGDDRIFDRRNREVLHADQSASAERGRGRLAGGATDSNRGEQYYPSGPEPRWLDSAPHGGRPAFVPDRASTTSSVCGAFRSEASVQDVARTFGSASLRPGKSGGCHVNKPFILSPIRNLPRHSERTGRYLSARSATSGWQSRA